MIYQKYYEVVQGQAYIQLKCRPFYVCAVYSEALFYTFNYNPIKSWASSRDFGTYRICEQPSLSQTCQRDFYESSHGRGSHHAVTHVRKNSNNQGRSPNVVYHKELLLKERIRSIWEQVLSLKWKGTQLKRITA